MKCKCGCGLFYAHQIVRVNIVVDEDNDFFKNASSDGANEDIPQEDIYDVGTPYGPYTCFQCGEVYDKLEG